MMQNFCRECGAEILMFQHVGKMEDGELICIGCVEDHERDEEAYLRSEEFQMERGIEIFLSEVNCWERHEQYF
jgi:hypothetical protein